MKRTGHKILKKKQQQQQRAASNKINQKNKYNRDSLQVRALLARIVEPAGNHPWGSIVDEYQP